MNGDRSCAAVMLVTIVLLMGCDGGNGTQAKSERKDAAVLHVSSPRHGLEPDAAFADAGMANTDLAWQRAIATHAYMIASHSTLAAVLANPDSGTSKTQWRARQKTPADAVAWLGQNLRVSPVPDTSLIEVSLGGGVDSKEAAIIVNDIAAQYLETARRNDTNKLVEQIEMLRMLRERYATEAKAKRAEVIKEAAALVVEESGLRQPPATMPESANRLADVRIRQLSLDEKQRELQTLQERVPRYEQRLDHLQVSASKSI